jgi:hypothetical protein
MEVPCEAASSTPEGGYVLLDITERIVRIRPSRANPWLGLRGPRTTIERLYPHPFHQRLHVTPPDLAPLGSHQASQVKNESSPLHLNCKHSVNLSILSTIPNVAFLAQNPVDTLATCRQPSKPSAGLPEHWRGEEMGPKATSNLHSPNLIFLPYSKFGAWLGDDCRPAASPAGQKIALPMDLASSNGTGV